MAFQVKFSERAATDLSEIIGYISDVLLNPIAAEHFYNEVDKKRQHIRENPKMYPLSRDERLKAKGYRVAVVGNYLLFYIVDDENAIAYIIRIVYSKRDLSSIV